MMIVRNNNLSWGAAAASLMSFLCFCSNNNGALSFAPPSSTTTLMGRQNQHHNVVAPLHAVSSTAIRPILPAEGFTKAKIQALADANGALEDLGIPFGLRQVLLQSLDLYKKRIWIVDNSGSMAMHDGHQVLQESDTATRWDEVRETVFCHATLAANICAPTDFRLLNPPSEGGPKSFRVGYNGRKAVILKDCKRIESSLRRSAPKGQTPLASSVATIRKEIVDMLPELQAENRKVAIVIATDGCNHDKSNVGSNIKEHERNQDLLRALKSLQGLPVTVVLRLCTDYGPLLNFFNVLDESLSEMRFGVDIDVLDDHVAEAEEVHEHNPWLNYALVLHRIREMGQDHVLFDLLDERPFSKEEIKEFCTLLFGVRDWPEDWKDFLGSVQVIQELEKAHVNPRTNQMEPWIDVGRLLAELQWDPHGRL